MGYENEDDTAADLVRANQLMEKGRELARDEKIKNALAVFTKALNIYLHTGKYLKLVETFHEMISIVQIESQIFPIKDKIQTTLNEIQYLDLPEINAELNLALANLAFKNQDYGEAMTKYVDAAHLFKELGEEYYQSSGMFLIRAAECAEKLGKYDRSQKYIFEAIQLFDVSNFDYHSQQKNLYKEIDNKKYEKAIEIIEEIQSFFRRLIDELELVGKNNVSLINIKNNVKARMLHLIAEYNFIKIICYRWLDQEDKIIPETKQAIEDLKEAIENVKSELKKERYSTADLHHLTFQMFLLQALQEFANFQEEDTVFVITHGLPKNIIKILKKMQFYEATMNVIKLNLKENIEFMKDMPLSQVLNPIRSFLLKSIENFCPRT